MGVVAFQLADAAAGQSIQTAGTDRETRPADGFKLDRLANNPALCFQLLDEAGVKYTRVDRDGDQPQCGLHNALTLGQSLTP